MSINFLVEYAIVNNLNSFINSKINSKNNRFLTGISFQIPSGKIIKRYDICFQTMNKISGIFLIRFHFLKKVV